MCNDFILTLRVQTDFSDCKAPQAAMTDALNSERLIKAVARGTGLATPLLDAGLKLFD